MVEENKQQCHILLVTLPAQGHINPSLQFAKNLIYNGALVTFITSLSAHRRILSNNDFTPLDGLTFAPFSDGYDDGYKGSDDILPYWTEFNQGTSGSESLTKLVKDLANQGRPVTCLIYTILLPWVADVAHKLRTPCTLLWIQPATVFSIYHYYFNGGYSEVIKGNMNDRLDSIQLPGLPLLSSRDLPSFILPSSPMAYSLFLEEFKEQLEVLERERKLRKGTPLKILVNTFDDLEHDMLKAIDDKFDLIGIGPLIPLAYLDGTNLSDTSFGGDLFTGSKDNDYIEWLNTKKKSTVVYASFGSLAVVEKKQMEEIARALAECGKPYLWVIRKECEKDIDEDEVARILKQGTHEGLIVPWCSQVQVLSHPAVGCFITHCGWNSTLESLVAGVPVVAFPQWTDQRTNAMLIENVWKIGVRVKANKENNMVESKEIKGCLEKVMDGEEGEEKRMNARKWQDLVRKAMAKGGSSDKNLQSFLELIG